MTIAELPILLIFQDVRSPTVHEMLKSEVINFGQTLLNKDGDKQNEVYEVVKGKEDPP